MESETVQAICSAITAAAAFAAAVAAWVGLQAWRKQLRSNVELEAARSVLRAAFKLRDKIKYVRNPLFFSADDTEIKRWNEHVEKVLPEWNEAKIEAEILWGESFREAAASLDSCLGELRGNLQSYFNRISRKEEEGWQSEDNQYIMELERKGIHDQGSEDKDPDRRRRPGRPTPGREPAAAGGCPPGRTSRSPGRAESPASRPAPRRGRPARAVGDRR